ncbi:MAG TPA: dehydratase [Micromonosporaceae bacterium]|nr:dehydratase [Micromonosporaceae bacterium]HCU51273.1 dehydratase [Micromonosporaceae bacterium]
MTAFASLAELRTAIGTEVGQSDWIEIDQNRINLFAHTTEDHQWIHTDIERAAEGPYGTTVAHGYLTLSLLPKLSEGVVSVEGVRIAVNYGLNKVRFPAPVPSGSRVRARFELLSVEDVEGGAQLTMQATVKVDGLDKPVCVAETVSRIYF